MKITRTTNLTGKFLTLLILISSSLPLFSQGNTSLKVVPIIENRSYELEGGLIVLGTSRVIIPINLPANTVEWYYVFSSNSNTEAVESKGNQINLVGQLTKIIDKSGTTASALSLLFAPSGSSASNVYLFNDYENAKGFRDKTDQELFTPAWKHLPYFAIESATQGRQKVDLTEQGTYYLGIQAGLSPVNVSIEVVAIVDESAERQYGWTSEDKHIVTKAIKDVLVLDKIPESQAESLSVCVTNSIMKNYPSQIFFSLNESAINSLVNQYLKNCYSDDLEANTTDEQSKATSYGNLGWQYYENGDIDKAIDYSIKALEMQQNLGYVKANLGLFYLLKGEELKANDFYIDAIIDFKKDKLRGKSYLKAAIDDIETARLKYETMSGYQSILNQLTFEFENW